MLISTVLNVCVQLKLKLVNVITVMAIFIFILVIVFCTCIYLLMQKDGSNVTVESLYLTHTCST